MLELSLDKKRLLDTEGHILALGGPGSGKTYIALLKAEHEIRLGKLLGGQRILFLSFARATIAQVAQRAGTLISGQERKTLEMNTYHGFAWNLLQSHGYLLNTGHPIRLLPPPEAASRLAEIDTPARPAEMRRLFEKEGLLHFDLFATLGGELLSKSQALTRIVCDAYPIIIVDEFQDTNLDEWKLIRILGKRSRIIALADPDQRIYEFRGADPKRIGAFITTHSPEQFDFGSENNRSNGTDIAIFGNELLTGANKSKTYNDVSVIAYQVRKGNGIHLGLKLAVLKGCQRLRSASNGDWSLAVLVPTKRMMLDVSDYLAKEQQFSNGNRLPPLSHEVALETNGPALAGILIAGLLEDANTTAETAQRMILDLCTYIRGHKGSDAPSQGELQLAGALGSYATSGQIRGKKRKLVAEECIRIAKERHSLSLSGDPSEDWLAVRKLLADSAADPLRTVAEEAQYLRLLHKGAALRSRLSELWRKSGGYIGAVVSVRDALLQEHFSTSTRKWNGIHVMTMHKSKGKEFNEVIVYEGSHQGRIAHINLSEEDVAQARLALRVAVTRAIERTIILTPKHDVCRFL